MGIERAPDHAKGAPEMGSTIAVYMVRILVLEMIQQNVESSIDGQHSSN
jgi:hypothetical protein